MKRIIVAIIIALCMCNAVQAAGLTIWGMTEQVANVDSQNALALRLGYYLGSDNGGLEPFVGSIWRPRWDEEGDMEPPQVLTLGLIYHSMDIVDPNNTLPWIPDAFLMILSEDVVIRPYIGFQNTWNFIDQDAGMMGGIAGVRVQTTPDSNTELIFEIGYDANFGDLSVVEDRQLNGYFGIRIPF